ncbi:MAG: hypothetical protein KGD73_13165 [Candidatus Lokiarchaeota archaeon]|nr:hypothetical protein [Candidatus Lokiarchaeota archaeon]
MADLGAIIIELVLYLIALLIIAIFMKIALGFFSNSKHTEFGQVFLTSFLMMLILFLFDFFLPGLLGLIIALILIWLLISGRHHTGFLGAILITIIAIVLYIVVAIIIGLLFGITLIALF